MNGNLMTEEFVATIFGMPPQDERQAIKSIMDRLGFPSIYKPAEPEPVIVQVPATVEQMHDTGNSIMYGQAIPTAVDLANTIAYAQGVPQETAIKWLAHRADTFKTLHAESTK
jgi:hypothetical protein